MSIIDNRNYVPRENAEFSGRLVSKVSLDLSNLRRFLLDPTATRRKMARDQGGRFFEH